MGDESLSKAFQNILEYASKKLEMNLRDYTFHVAQLDKEGVGVVYFPKNPKGESIFISYNSSVPDFKMGHMRGSDIYLDLFLKNLGLTTKNCKDFAVSINGDTEWEHEYHVERDLDFEKIEEVDDNIRRPLEKSGEGTGG